MQILDKTWPSSRSGFGLAVDGDVLYLYGGYYKQSLKDGDAKARVMTDLWVRPAPCAPLPLARPVYPQAAWAAGDEPEDLHVG